MKIIVLLILLVIVIDWLANRHTHQIPLQFQNQAVKADSMVNAIHFQYPNLKRSGMNEMLS